MRCELKAKTNAENHRKHSLTHRDLHTLYYGFTFIHIYIVHTSCDANTVRRYSVNDIHFLLFLKCIRIRVFVDLLMKQNWKNE